MMVGSALLFTALLGVSLWKVHAQTYAGGSSEVLTLHGSGTTNPSKCYWDVMNQFRAQAKHPIYMTYRGVGSTVGQQEFTNDFDVNGSAAAFGSGDIPFTSKDYENLLNRSIEVVHLPVLVGSVSFFHSVEAPAGTPVNLNLTACLLARIFTKDIITWDHPDILAENSDFDASVLAEPNITVVVRAEGSSSTSAATGYMNQACPESFSTGLVGTKPDWPTGNVNNTLVCSGSDGVVACIQGQTGAIGYAESGHGVAAMLQEVEVANADGTLQTSAAAHAQGGIKAAAESIDWPTSALDDFGSINLLNRPGQYTWPLVLMTYIYVRKDLSFIKNPNEQSLLIAFLKALYDPDYVQVCEDKYGFILPSTKVLTLGQQAITLLENSISPNATEWIFEKSTLPIMGMGPYVLSSKRQQTVDIEIGLIEADDEATQATLVSLQEALDASQARVALLETSMAQLQADGGASAQSNGNTFTDQDKKQLKAALVLASLSFGLTCVGLLAVATRVVTKP